MPFVRRTAVLLVTVSAVLAAGLVPVPFLTDPPVQRLTRAEALEHWGYDFFGQCRGAAVMPMPRLASGDSIPMVLVFSDCGRDQLVYCVWYEKDGRRGMVWHFGDIILNSAQDETGA
jgi:hypothetical protein